MPHHCSPQRLHLLRFFFFAFTSRDILEKLPRIEIPGHCRSREFCFQYREPREYPPERNNRRQSRIPGIPVQSLSFLESAPIPAGIPDP